MPDGSFVRPAEKPVEDLSKPSTWERANRVHALIVALHNQYGEGSLVLGEVEAENVMNNLISMAVDESRALLASDFA